MVRVSRGWIVNESRVSNVVVVGVVALDVGVWICVRNDIGYL